MSIIEKAMDKLGVERSATQARPVTEEQVHSQGPGTADIPHQDTASQPAPGVGPQGELESSLHSPSEIADATQHESPIPAQVVSSDKTHGPNFVEIPFDTLSELGIITPHTPRSQIAEEFRTIKRPLLLNLSERSATRIEHANLIMVTSALQGDGKTFSAINLALSMAMEQDKTVLFVDADVSKATAGRLLGVSDKRSGLIDILDGNVESVADVILKTNVHNLRILPAGNVHDRSTELLAGGDMQRLMLEISERYRDRVIVFDSPPLLLTTEAGVLTNFMGQIVFVVAADSTPAGAVTAAIEHISNDKVIGMVLNKAKRGRLGPNSYGYGYGYGYGDGYGYGRRQERAGEES